MTHSDPQKPDFAQRCWPLPLVVAMIALAAVIATLDSSGAVPGLGEGPGMTLDETFNVQMGVYHVQAAAGYGLALLHPDSIDEVFGHEAYNPDHPPLGRLVIGIAHEITRGLLNPDVPDDVVCVTCGRVGTACGFALTIFLVGWMTARWFGRSAGVIAAIAIVLMPRLFAHGHLAALESFVSLTYVVTILWVADRWSGQGPPRRRDVLIGGVLLGLCLLTKIQAVLLPIPIGLWTLWRWRLRAVVPMLAFGLTGLAVFFVGWPWLWLDPVEHLAEYFGRATDRETLYCWYMGHKWADTDVPWHYSLVMFAVTVPVGLHVLGVLGVFAGQVESEARNPEHEARNKSQAQSHKGSPGGFRHSASGFVSCFVLRISDFLVAGCRTPRTAILLLNIFWPLIFFALPGITVYDGTRLFLMVFPLWAIFVGIGGARLLEMIARRWSSRTALAVLAILLSTQSVGLIRMHPLGLSYYNALTGGLHGAVALGFEPTYWGDSVTRSFLDEVAETIDPDRPLDVAPVLHPFQLKELRAQSPALQKHGISLRAYDDTTGQRIDTVLVIRRRADSWAALSPEPAGRLIAEVARGGVQLAGAYDLRPSPTAD